jgi:DNA-binding MarR family transcriptional regulator
MQSLSVGGIFMKRKKRQHISIPFDTLNDHAYQELTPESKIILHEMLMFYYPRNSLKPISMPYSRLRNRLKYTNYMIQKSLHELIEKGFIKITKNAISNQSTRYEINDNYFGL